MDASHRLREAVIKGHLGITKRLLARFPELWLNTDASHSGWTNLHYASYYGNYLVCFHLISHMARRSLQSIDLVTFDDLTVLHLPVFRRHSQTLHLLLQEFSGGSWLNYGGGPLRRTPLHYCCVHHFDDGLKLLLEFGADWTLADENGDTCLHLCFAYNSVACMEQLIRFVAAKSGDFKKGSGAEENGKISEEKQVRPWDGGDESATSTLKGLDSSCSLSIQALEAATNNRNYKPAVLAASFELQQQYPAMRACWVERALAEQRSLSQMYPFDPDMSPFQKSGSECETPRPNTLQTDISPLRSSVTQPDEDPKPSSRQHSASLPPASNEDKPQFLRRHSKSLVSGFGSRQQSSAQIGSPLSLRAPTTPHASSNPKSPLQVEFHRSHSRKSLSSAPYTRPEPNREDLPEAGLVQDDASKCQSVSLNNTPGSSKSVHQFYFSPLSGSRRQSDSGSSSSADRPERMGVSSRNSDYESRNSSGSTTPGSRVPLSRTSSTKTLSAAIRRNASTPSVMQSPSMFTFSSTSSVSHSMGSAESIKRPPLKLPSDQHRKSSDAHRKSSEWLQKRRSSEIIDRKIDDDLDRGVADNSMESLSEEKALSFPITKRQLKKTEDPSKEPLKRSGNVSSISFTSIRDE